MGLRDYNHLRGPRQFAEFAAFYTAMVAPGVRTAGATRGARSLPGGSMSYSTASPVE